MPLLDALPGASLARTGRELHDIVGSLLASRDGTVAVLPMTWGRDPVMVAEAAKTLRWLVAGGESGRVALCGDLGTPDHLVAWLRRAAVETARRRPGAAIVVTAPAANPFDDAELYRLAHLVRVHGAVAEVEVACVEEHDDLADAVRRARLLGADDVVAVPAGFARTSPVEGVDFFGQLVSDQALLRVVRDRVAAAVHDLGHGHDGIEAGLLADHGHGYAHSHAFEESAGPEHQHPHPHARPHVHGDAGPSHRHASSSETPSVHGVSPLGASTSLH